MLPLLLTLALAGAGAYGWYWWTTGRFIETTDNAYLQSDKVVVSPRIAGMVAEVLVGDNQPVAAGQVLARLDDRERRILLTQAQAEVERDKAQLQGVAAALIQQKARIEGAEADVANTNAALTFSKQENERYRDLLRTGAGTVQRQQQAEADLHQRQAAADRAAASLDAARKQVESLRALEGAARASLEAAGAKAEQAQLNLDFTTITAPIRGVVGDRSVRLGQFVAAGTNLLTLVPMGRDLYLVANFKETQVGAMAAGQAVTLTVDALPGHVVRGRIVSFAPGTGAQFALLPPENATGNFTKIVQRVPVRIAIDPDDPLLGRLRPGLSVEASVYLRPPKAPR
ncbi:HlyD family secretion protein [Methylobacterium sp. R2-1]|uniref:HlyD family secretion protein n=1 Tax=Methylobacterium sp. R2-1 TaxID=2587064 RepID=UPI0028B0A3EE|nr:HlyD family secretion protein [Methylobacterium sp. R2-1]